LTCFEIDRSLKKAVDTTTLTQSSNAVQMSFNKTEAAAVKVTGGEFGFFFMQMLFPTEKSS